MFLLKLIVTDSYKSLYENFDNDLSQSQQDISFPDSEDVNPEIAKQLSSIFVSKYASHVKTPKIFSKNKNIFISYLEYVEFIIKYIEAKYTIKSKSHKIKGFIKYQLGKNDKHYNW